MSCPLLRCPSEIIEGIISFLNEHSDLRSFASTCSKLQPLTEAALYHTVFHRTGDAAVQLVETIEALPARAKYIQIIDSRCKWQKRMGLKSLASVIEQATNLRELTIESPYCKYAYGKEAAEWRETMYALLRPICLEGCFPILRDLTLHLSGSKRYWIFDGHFAHILAHPTILNLTLSCAELHEDELHVLQQRPKSPLRKLTLIECNVTLGALAYILCVPQALEEFHLGENCYHQWLNSPQFRNDREWDISQLCSTDVEQFFYHLGQQKHSLRVMTYIVRGPSIASVTLPNTCKGFAEFDRLETIVLDGYCPYFEKAMSTRKTAPPNLISLTAKGDMFRLQSAPELSLMDNYQSQVGWTIAAASFSKHLQNVTIVSSRTFTNISGNHRAAVTELGRSFRDRGVGMQLLKRTFHRNIPPFLYGEEEYREQLVYDSVGGFTRAIGSSGDREEDDIHF